MFVNERLELLLHVELGLDFPALELVAFVESIDSIQGTESVDEHDIDWSTRSGQVEVDALNISKLNKISTLDTRSELIYSPWSGKCLPSLVEYLRHFARHPRQGPRHRNIPKLQ
jgi:hypothetical protein